jgi:nitrate reductase gamma subunit
VSAQSAKGRKNPGPTPWTRPLAGSTYPLALANEKEDPGQTSVRFMAGVMAIMVLAAYYLFASLVNSFVVYLGYLSRGRPGAYSDYFEKARVYSTIWGVLGSHLGLASLIVVVWLYMRFIHRRQIK